MLCCVVLCCVLQDIQNAAAEENMDVIMPAHLNRIDKVRLQHTHAPAHHQAPAEQWHVAPAASREPHPHAQPAAAAPAAVLPATTGISWLLFTTWTKRRHLWLNNCDLPPCCRHV